MSDENEKLELPEKPSSPWRKMVKGAFTGFLVGGVISGVTVGVLWLRGRKITSGSSETFVEGIRDALLEAPSLGTLVGGGMGYAQGINDQAQNQLKAENRNLQQKVAALEADKSFTKTLVQEKIDAVKDKDCGCKMRG
jgi:hypothetical protein